MARKRQRVAKSAQSQQDAIQANSLEDALAATAQHTVPILPAGESASPDLAAAPTREVTSYARRTLAPIPSIPQTRTAQPLPQAPRSDASLTGEQTARYTAQPRRTAAPRSPGRGDEATGLDEEMLEDGEQGPGLPTFLLPSITSAKLPAVISDEQRAVAARCEPEAPALLIRGSTKLPSTYRLLAPRRHGPRPFAAQFIISMATVMVLFTTLTLASPLGHGSVFADAFQAYGNAVPWIPTPTPTPRPTPTPKPYSPPQGANPGQQAVINDIVAVFGGYSQGALNIARCESGYDPNAWNPYAIGNSHASGVFQILYPSTWVTTSYASQSPYNYDANIHAAYEIFSRDGHSWVEWACKP